MKRVWKTAWTRYLPVLALVTAAGSCDAPEQQAPAPVETRNEAIKGVKRNNLASSKAAREVSSKVLTAEPGSAPGIAGLRLIRFSDGRTLIRGVGTFDAVTSAKAYHYQIDKARGTYSAEEIDPALVEAPVSKAGRNSRGFGKLGTATAAQTKNGVQAISSAQFSFAHQVMVRLQTLDPAFVRLNETALWTDYNTDGNVLQGGMDSDWCWAAQPSSLGTNWFIDYWDWADGYGDNVTMHCTGTLYCGYHNWDFGFEGLWTIVDHTLDVCVQPDQHGKYTWSHWDDGEGSELTFGNIVFSKF
jgi:hypothetical protein